MKPAVIWMKYLNKSASEWAVEFGVRGATDITGFSLLGHAYEMASASKVALRFLFENIPFTQGAKRYANDWIFPGGSSDNRLFYGKHVNFSVQVDESSKMLLFDAQTSGGLLLCVPPDQINAFMKRAKSSGEKIWIVGEVEQGKGIFVE